MVTRVCAFASCPPLVLLLSSSFHPHCLCPGPGHCLIPTQGQLSGQISWSPTSARVIFLKDPHASKSDLNTLLRPSRSFLPSLQHSTSPSWPERSCSSLLAFAPCRGGVGGPASSPTSVFGILLFLQGPTKTISADSYIPTHLPQNQSPCLSPQSSDSRTFQLKSWTFPSAQGCHSAWSEISPELWARHSPGLQEGRPLSVVMVPLRSLLRCTQAHGPPAPGGFLHSAWEIAQEVHRFRSWNPSCCPFLEGVPWTRGLTL